jgi:predicted glutamine amidotransferase
MCGLVGIMSSNMLKTHKDAFSELIYLDTFRGRDATGVAALRHNADTDIQKSTIPGYEFLEGGRLDHLLRLNDFCWIGHNRWGTVGRNIKTNAHPFLVYDQDGGVLLVGAHNGTLKNKYDLIDHMKFGTDSEALFNNIAAEGLKDTIAKVGGAWALSYYDHLAEEMRFLRNKERPLHYAFEEGRKTLIWASEIWMIQVACQRNNVKLENGKVYSFDEDTLYKFAAPIKVNDVITFETEGGLAGKAPQAFFQGGDFWSERGTWVNGKKVIQEGAPQTPTPPRITAENSQFGMNPTTAGDRPNRENLSLSNNQSKDNITPLKKYKGYNGKLLTKKELEEILATGCSWCDKEKVTIFERHAFLSEHEVVCHKCLTGEHEDLDEIEEALFASSAYTVH